MQKIKIIELFSGIGAQVAALKRLRLDYEVVGISEIDKYAIQSYEAINGPTYNYGDITKIPMLDYADLWTYSFPCQDLSVAGKQAGINEGTRSGLLLHVERLLENAIIYGNQPKYLLLENVKALVGKKFKPDFERWLGKLDLLGYNNYWQVLNAKDYGVPQNRERVFVVSIRKDIDTKGYKFPEKIPLTRKLKDVLEPMVDEKYYLSDKQISSFMKESVKSVEKGNGFCFKPISENDISRALTLKCGGGRKTDTFIQEPLVCASRGRNPDNPSDRTTGVPTKQRLEINNTGCSNTLTSVQKDNYLLEPQVLTPKRNEYGKIVRKAYESGDFKESRHNMIYMTPRNDGISNTLTTVQKDNYIIQRAHGFNKGNIFDKAPTLTANGKYQDNNYIIQENINLYPNSGNPQAGRIYNPEGISPALDTCQGGNRMPKISENISNYRIRRLTPLECWRLMDFTDDEFYAAQLSGISNSQLYKQASNSICVCVLAAIFKELLA